MGEGAHLHYILLLQQTVLPGVEFIAQGAGRVTHLADSNAFQKHAHEHKSAEQIEAKPKSGTRDAVGGVVASPRGITVHAPQQRHDDNVYVAVILHALAVAGVSSSGKTAGEGAPT